MFNLRRSSALTTPSIILFIALICSFIIVATNLYSILKNRELSQRWQYLSNDVIEASYHLNNVERYFGYGGFIHHFKNLVLRREEAYIDLAEEKLFLTLEHLKQLKRSKSLASLHTDFVEIEKVILNYREKFYAIKNREIKLGQVPANIDKVVKVDDNLALLAMDRIINEIETTRLRHKQELDFIQRELGHSTKYLLSAIVASLLCLAGLILLYLKTRQFSQQFESLFEHSPNALFEINSSGQIIKLNYKAMQMFQYSENELLGAEIEILLPTSYVTSHVKHRNAFIKDPKVFHRMAIARQVFARNKSGEEFPVEISLSLMTNENDETVVIADVIDVTDKYKFKIQSQYDHLTRLFNRRTFEEKLTQELLPPVEENSSIILLDIDHFKRVNDQFGHLVGDHVLMQFSDIIHRLARKNDVLCRWGGEEFLILAPNLELDDLMSTCERFREAIGEYTFDDVNHLTCSIGATMIKSSDTVESVIERADEALYQAKDSGRNRSIVN